MTSPDSILLSGSNFEEIIRAYNDAISKLEPDIRQQLAAVLKKYLGTYGPDGICEHFDGQTVAQVIAKIPPEELQNLVRNRFVWLEVRTTALTGPATAVKALSCPKCHGPLLVRYDPAFPQPDKTTAGFLIIRCLQCSGGCAADGLKDVPPWVESLGPSFQTQSS